VNSPCTIPESASPLAGDPRAPVNGLLSAHKHFRQLGAMLGWGPKLRIGMLWAFLDESGQYANGKLVRLTVGGCIAPFDVWEALSMYWAEAIGKMGLSMFHMTDFEARVPPYRDWTDTQRKDRLNALLNLIGDGKPVCWSATNIHRQNDTNETMYERCAQDALLNLGLYEDELAVVFAQHPEYRRHNQFLSVLVKNGIGHNIKTLTVANPQSLCPLQAADIVAYEIRCEERLERPRRYPLLRLMDLGCTFKFGMSAN
jgi:hypothetical protein